MAAERVVHLATRSDWAQARDTGQYTGSTLGAALADVGFVHASTVSQLPGVLSAFYRDQDLDDFVLLVVDPDATEAAGTALVWEPPPGTDLLFPHLYGPIPLAAVVATLPVTRAPDGSAQLPDLSAHNVRAEPPPR